MSALEITLKKVNKYIHEHCVCDGMGPMDSFSDLGNFEDLTLDDLTEIIKIIGEKNDNRKS